MKHYLYLSILYLFYSAAYAQESPLELPTSGNRLGLNLDYQLKGGFNFGGSTPIPFPQEIRAIKNFNPTLAVTIEAHATHWLEHHQNWGIRSGLRYDLRGMKSDAEVKNYSTEIIGDGGERLKGYFTGETSTSIRNSYLTIPILAVYRLSPNWDFNFGPYLSILLSKRFKGRVGEGYLRDPDPTGIKTNFTEENGATFDFSDQINPFQWGAQLGTAYRLAPKIQIYSDFSWGFNNLFKKDFETISFKMYTLNLNLGVAYDL